MDWRQPAVFAVLAGLILVVDAQGGNRPPVWNANSVLPLQRGFREDTPIGTFLTQLICVDPDGDNVRYTLRTGKAVRVFVNGTVTLAVQLDFEPQDSVGYDLTFVCQDVNGQGLGINPEVPINTEISVDDANDNAPIFQVSNAEGYSFSVSEAAPVGTIVEDSIRTVDRDRTVNAILDTMYLICNSPKPEELATLTESSREMCNYFQLNYSQVAEGEYKATITLIKQVDYETRPVYSSKLVAIDGPGLSVQLSTTVNVQINILDAQDVPPYFTNLGDSGSVSEGAVAGTVINFGISARDGDTGDKRAIALEIINDPQDAFNLTTPALVPGGEGIYESKLVVKNPLDREKNLGGSYEFVVKATELDKNTSRPTTATATATYSVDVTDINDMAPTFVEPIYYINVTEMEATNASVQITGLHIECYDLDEPSNAQYSVNVVQQFLNANQQQIQAYVVSPGVDFQGNASMFLKVNAPRYLDYDIPEYRTQTVVLKAEEIGTKEKFSGSTTISIFLVDINDNSPVFQQPSYTTSIREDTQPPANITSVTATDKDSGLFGKVVYSLEGGADNKFTINPNTGQLTLIGDVDYETQSEYVFLITARDSAAAPRSTQVQMIVYITNVNDMSPIFDQNVYQTSVNESSLQFLNPITIRAVDPEDNTRISYRIIDGQPPNNPFQLDSSTGRLTLTGFLNYDDTPVGPDGKKTGVFNLTVEASDNGTPPETSRATILVTVIDENNHPPVLNPREYTASLSELAPAGTSVAQIVGTDADGGDNGRISYRIGAGLSDNFFVNSSSGLITVGPNAALDYDVQNRYRLEVIATDGGAPQKSATATVFVDITDANNKDPYFSEQLYVQNVDETVPLNTVVLNVQAIDVDTSKSLEYEILKDTVSATDSDGNRVSPGIYDSRNAFGVLSNGSIYVNKTLDKDIVQEFGFTLLVRDKNTQSGAGTGTTQITITVSGEAESGIFFDPVNQVFMNEDASPGYSVITVTARDPSNQPVSNYIKVGGSGNFSVDRTTGAVRLQSAIDYEHDTYFDHLHRVVIEARSNNGQESATVTVTISIVDVNDNPPIFDQRLYTASVSENARYPTQVVSIYATDADSRSYGPLRFRISGGLGADDFYIFHDPVPFGERTSRRAQVLVAQGKTLDYNNRSQYNLDLIVGDNDQLQFSSSRLYSQAQLQINVIDENNNAPIFKESVRNHSVAETAPIGLSVATMIATDKDFGKNGDIVYSLEAIPNEPLSQQGLELFRISPTLGTVTVAKSLLGRGNKIYPVRVRATDRGDIPQTSFMTLRITVLSTEDNDGNPKWLYPDNGYVLYAPEETPNYTLRDQRYNSTRFFDVLPRNGTQVVYRLAPASDYYSSFSINMTTGEITIIDSLDREIKESYVLLVYAEDTVDRDKYRTGRQLVVRLLDKNDNNPSFYDTRYGSCPVIDRPLLVYVNEGTPVNTTVYTLRACDPDADNNNAIYYQLYNTGYGGETYCADNNAESGLTVMRDGRLVTNREIDYEQKSVYLMCVQAIPVIPADGTRRKREVFNITKVDQTLMDVAYLEVIIRDLNDNGPKFRFPTASGVVQTDPASGPVVTLDATDPDSPENNVIKYRIASSVFYPAENGAPKPIIGAFSIQGAKGIINHELPSYKDFVGGRFVLEIVATDAKDPTMMDTQIVTIYVHERGHLVKVVLDMNPSQGSVIARPLIQRLDAVSSRYMFVFKQVSEHVYQGGRNPTQTDICFLVVETAEHKILDKREVLDVLDTRTYKNILEESQYKMVERGQCFPTQSSEDSIKWSDLWWVLVAVGIFIFICCLILIVLVTILYSRYKRYMKSQKTYMVPQ